MFFVLRNSTDLYFILPHFAQSLYSCLDSCLGPSHFLPQNSGDGLVHVWLRVSPHFPTPQPYQSLHIVQLPWTKIEKCQIQVHEVSKSKVMASYTCFAVRVNTSSLFPNIVLLLVTPRNLSCNDTFTSIVRNIQHFKSNILFVQNLLMKFSKRQL